MTPPRSPAVLVVENESRAAQDLQRTLAGLGYNAFAVATSTEQALARAAEQRPDVALVDIRIKGREGGVRTAQLLQERFGVPVVYLTADADDAALERAKETRASGYLLKPVEPADLKSALETALVRQAPPRTSTAPAAPARPARLGVRVVRRQVEKILASADFDASRRSKEFLRYIVEETLGGRGDDLTQSSIATRVFGRREDFDPVVDPIVRIQAGRLRRSLERYYLLSGREDAVRIELPRGTYVPAFHARAEAEPATVPEPAPEPRAPIAAPEDWPWVVVRNFEPEEPATAQAASAARITEELLLELGRYREVRVLLEHDLDQLEASARGHLRFFLGGRLRTEDGDLRVTAQLVDRTTGEHLWGDEYHTAPAEQRWSGSPADIARVVAARVGGEEGVVVQHLAAERRKRRDWPTTPHGALLLAYEFFLARDPASFSRALDALRQAVKAEPESARAWTTLARLCLSNHTFEVTTIPTPTEEAIACSQNGVRVDPTSRRARCLLASALLVKGELAAARAELDEALRLSPDSLVYLEIIGYLLSLLGDGERGPALIRSARERNPHWLPHASLGLWFDSLRRGEVEEAYRHALEYRDPVFFWRAAMRACCLGHLGRDEEAAAEVGELLRSKPDFEARGRVLLGYYVKDADVMGRVVDGLASAGLRLA